MGWLVWVFVACAPSSRADAVTLKAVDTAFCTLVTDCWELYDTVGDCLVDNSHSQASCTGAPEVVMEHCARTLRAQVSECPALSTFAYPAECWAYCQNSP